MVLWCWLHVALAAPPTEALPPDGVIPAPGAPSSSSAAAPPDAGNPAPTPPSDGLPGLPAVTLPEAAPRAVVELPSPQSAPPSPLSTCSGPNGCPLLGPRPFLVDGPVNVRVEHGFLYDEHGCRPTFEASVAVDVATYTLTLRAAPDALTRARTGLCRALARGEVSVDATLPAAGTWTIACESGEARCDWGRVFVLPEAPAR